MWRPIVGYEGRYEVSDTGDVKSLLWKEPKLLKPADHEFGYKCITLSDSSGKTKRLLIHRLVAQAFIHQPEGKTDVNHIDGNKTNNNVSNLEWVSKSENMYHAYRTGIRTVTEKQRGVGRHKSQETIEKLRKVSERKLQSIRDPNRLHNTVPANEARKTKVICLDTGKIYNSMHEADIDIGASSGAVSNAINAGERIYGLTFVKV